MSEILDRIEAILEGMAASREADRREMVARREADQQQREADRREIAAQREADRQQRVADRREMADRQEADRQQRVADRQQRVAEWREVAAIQVASRREMTSLKSRVRSLERIVPLDRQNVEQVLIEISQMTAAIISLQVSNSPMKEPVFAPDRDK